MIFCLTQKKSKFPCKNLLFLSGNPDLNRGPLRPELIKNKFNLVSFRFTLFNIQIPAYFVKFYNV